MPWPVVVQPGCPVSGKIEVTIELPDGKGEETRCIGAGQGLDGFLKSVADKGYSVDFIYVGKDAYAVHSFRLSKEFENYKFDGPTRVKGSRSSVGFNQCSCFPCVF